MPSTKRLLELAVIGLETERERINEELRQLRQQLGHAEVRQKPERTVTKMAARRTRKMSPTARKLISKRMREVWAQRRKAA